MINSTEYVSPRFRYSFLGNHGPNAVQGPTTKQHAIEVLEYTSQCNIMIYNESNRIIALDEKSPTLQE